jgi:uncharacterized protein
MIEVRFDSVRVKTDLNKHVLLLQETQGSRVVALWVGQRDADAAARAHRAIATHRPSAHHLVLNAIALLGGRCIRVEITELVERAYHALIVVERDGHELTLDARPTDAITLALHAGVPILVNEDLLDEPEWASEPDRGVARDRSA